MELFALSGLIDTLEAGDRTLNDMRVGVAFAGDAEDPTARSGTPFGVLSAIRELGLSAVALKAAPPTNIDRAVAAIDAVAHLVARRSVPTAAQARETYSGAHLAKLTAKVRGSVLARRRELEEIDVIVALGTGYDIPADIPYVVYDDMTVQQAVAMEYPVWMAMRESDRAFRVEQQRRIYHGAQMCCMTTTWAAESVIRDYGVPSSRVVVVGAGTHETVRTVERDWSVPRFLFIGLDWNRKNGARVLAAFASLRDRIPEATLDVVGGHPPIEQDGVTTHGRLYRNDASDLARLKELYDRATCFAMPSVHEPGGVVFVEAAAVGVGSIAGNRGGSADFVGDAGFVVNPFDEGAIFDAMVSMSDPATARSCGQRASARAGLFTWPQVAGRILTALRPEVDLPIMVSPLGGSRPAETQENETQ